MRSHSIEDSEEFKKAVASFDEIYKTESGADVHKQVIIIVPSIIILSKMYCKISKEVDRSRKALRFLCVHFAHMKYTITLGLGLKVNK